MIPPSFEYLRPGSVSEAVPYSNNTATTPKF